MPFGGTAAQARRQAIWARYLDQTATVLRATATVSATGGRTVTWGTVAARVPARWQPTAGGNEAVTAGAVWATGPMLIMLPAGTTVQEADRIRQEADGSLWEVKGVDSGRSYEYGVQAQAFLVTA